MRILPFSYLEQRDIAAAPTPGRPTPITTNLEFWADAGVTANASTWTDQQLLQAGTVDSATYTSTDPYYYSFAGPNQGNEIVWSNSSGQFDFSQWSVSMWIRFADNNNVNYALASQRQTVGSSGNRFSLHANPSTDIIGIYSGTTGFKRNGTAGLFSAGNWYFCTWASDGGDYFWYVNDVYSSGDLSGNFNASETNIDFAIGSPNANLTTYGGEWFSGDIGYVLYYSSKISYTDHQSNYNTTKGLFGL